MNNSAQKQGQIPRFYLLTCHGVSWQLPFGERKWTPKRQRGKEAKKISYKTKFQKQKMKRIIKPDHTVFFDPAQKYNTK